MSSLLAFALVLASPSQVHLGPAQVETTGPSLPDGARQREALTRWMRSKLDSHAQTQFEGRWIPRRQGGGVLLVREFFAGLPIAGSRMALRLDREGDLRQVVGKAMRKGRPLGTSSAEGADMWWPQDEGLVAVRIVDDPVHYVAGHPQQMRRALRVSDGVELGAWSILDEADLPVRGWREDPVTTPDGEDFMVEVFDASPPYLQNDFIRIVECNWDEQEMTCAPELGAPGDPVTGWTADLPALDDEQAHANLNDQWAGPNSMQLAMRFLEKLEQWGWSREVWDVIDCEWQGVPDEECQLWYRVNVSAQDEEGVFPFVGAYYSTASGIYMGQAVRSDTAFDGDIVVHEIGHHVTRGYGTPEPTELPVDRSRRFADRQSINEGTSDFFARQMMSNDRIYDYFTTLEPGIYTGDRIRDVGIDFRCPEHLTGETHMDGRIWVSALRDAQVQLAQQGLATEDEFMAAFLVALASIRQIPREIYEQFPPAIDILVDEVTLANGTQAGAVVHGVFESRGLRSCHRTREIRENPVTAGSYDPDDPLDARFMLLSSWSENYDPEHVFNSPAAPPVHHRVTLGPDETSITFRYRVDLWRPKREDKETPPFRGSLLLKEGSGEISFWNDEESGYRLNDADLRIDTLPQDAEGWAEVTVGELTPGASYDIAFCSSTAISGDSFVIWNMSWELGQDEGGEEGETTATTTTGEESEGSEVGSGGFGDDGRPNEGGNVAVGCACSAEPGAPVGGTLALLALLGLRRRRD